MLLRFQTNPSKFGLGHKIRNKTHFLFNNPIKVTEYKKLANKLNWLKNICKKNYFSQHFDLCKNNLKASWKLIGKKIKRNNRAYTNKAEIADPFNKYFVNVGQNLAKRIENCDGSPTQFIRSTPVASFVMSCVTVLLKPKYVHYLKV